MARVGPQRHRKKKVQYTAKTARACVYMCVRARRVRVWYKGNKVKPKPSLSLPGGGPTNLKILFIWTSSIVIVF